MVCSWPEVVISQRENRVRFGSAFGFKSTTGEKFDLTLPARSSLSRHIRNTVSAGFIFCLGHQNLAIVFRLGREELQKQSPVINDGA